MNSSVFCGLGLCFAPLYYYQAFILNVSVTDYYTFTSNSNMDTFGQLYNSSFLPGTPSQNLIASNNDDGGNQQFSLYLLLNALATYILVVRTNTPGVTGAFSISATGSASISFSPINVSGKI
jgi:hypothetical protein